MRDYSCGYRAYRAHLLRAAAAAYGPRLIEGRGFTVMAELLVKLDPFHPTIAEVPLKLRYGLKIGRSKMRIARTIGEYLDLLRRRVTPGPVGAGGHPSFQGVDWRGLGRRRAGHKKTA